MHASNLRSLVQTCVEWCHADVSTYDAMEDITTLIKKMYPKEWKELEIKLNYVDVK